MNSFLSEVDAAARSRSAGHKVRTGASVQHAMACAARWTADHAGLPFEVAKLPTVRRASAPVREAEPRWAEMWEPAVLIHLLRVALDEHHRSLVRATAASVYLVCVASMRLVNGLRSAPPLLDSSHVFHGLAVLSKGRRRSSMAPSPWSVPCVSPDGSISDTEVAFGLQSALSFLPSQCCSMFPQLLDACGKPAALERAVAACPTARASGAQLETSVTFLLTLPPMSLSRAEARKIASRKHGPRHLMPEVARVLGLPVSARHEIGMWSAGYTTVMVARPSPSAAGEWEECFFRVPGHNFGLASAVLNFYHTAEPPTVFSRLFFGTPVTRYYDDHGVHEPSYAAGSGQECHFALHELLRFHFDFAKHEPWARSVVYTGVRTDWSRDSEGIVTIGVSAFVLFSVEWAWLLSTSLGSASVAILAQQSMTNFGKFSFFSTSSSINCPTLKCAFTGRACCLP
mmetsp:Transcript_23861/g.59265  ORF Transcript_23861/g.59265 Transcript_23861/m.59265 type:complete len:457 (+) Transcript_23861:1016-2386(+)